MIPHASAEGEPVEAPAPVADKQETSTAPEEPEEVFYEGSGSNAELVLSLALAPTLIYLPLTLASIGKKLWISYKFTNKRLVVTTNSPVLKREVQVAYDKIKEIRTAPRAFGLWGDMVVFLKDGSRLELAGIDKFQEVKEYMQARLT